MKQPDSMDCPVCNTRNGVAFQNVLLDEHVVNYFYCDNCGLLHTEEPYWLEQAYSHAIAGADTGLVLRNQMVSERLAAALFLLFEGQGQFLDLAGGTGLLVRMMRDIGFDYYWEDKFCDNVIARGFEHRQSNNYSAVTAVEVMEHLPQPMQFIEQAFSNYGCKTLIFTTELFEGAPPPPDQWHYYASAEGQHITFYQKRTLEFIGTQLGLNFYSAAGLHILTDRVISDRQLKRLRRTHLRAKLTKSAEKSMVSKTQDDHHLMLEAARKTTNTDMG